MFGHLTNGQTNKQANGELLERERERERQKESLETKREGRNMQHIQTIKKETADRDERKR